METQVFVSPNPAVPDVIFPDQCHSGIAKWVQHTESDVQTCDALITCNRGIQIGVHTRDCAPVCFFDGTRIAVAHVGWRGFTQDIISSVRSELSPEMQVYVGPFLHEFEVKKDACYDALSRTCGTDFFANTGEEIMFHFKDALASFLPPHTVFDTRSTRDDMTLPSHRHNRNIGHIITTVRFPS